MAWSSGTSSAPPASASVRAFAVWWSSVAWGYGTSTAGSPTTASSATVPAPALVTATSAAA